MDFWNYLREHILAGQGFEGKLFYSLLALLIFWIIRLITLRILLRGREITAQYRIRKIVIYITWPLAFLVVGRIWFTGFEAISTYLGLLSAGLAIALQSPLVNLAGWGFILWRQPFKVGDRVQIGDQRGDVIDQRIFMFSLMEIGNWVDADQSTGRILHVPNGKIFSEVLANYRQGFQYIWNEIPVLVTFESDWRMAKALLLEVVNHHGGAISATAQQELREAAKKYMIFYRTLTPTVYTAVKDSGVMLTMRYLCDPRKRRTTEQDIWESVLEVFGRHDNIDFAYPTQRHYLNDREGKPGTRPEALFGTDTSSPAEP
ncbi:mechanosensitive ion channel family protein [Geopsychrobacter electrodiphilus]|uniref:mechanosensitive ion channel family protein n=1 Tax=Geopsychrobacter electrodiphilus TaxID=225196 RepID=UPI00037648D7|nr:mechanosensitive ion channel family protein [Geopsychrobacter electrodiphilus]